MKGNFPGLSLSVVPAIRGPRKESQMTSISSLQTNNDNPLLRVPREHKLEFKDFMDRQMKLPESDTRWRGMCESLQRQAHGFDAAFGSAYAHMVAVPKSERMDPREAPRTAFIFV